eukprot:CAMPEP_0204345266 /NCGR_PEP_ID=MMETSP0469-20131031/26259_1 /ASSEMBLY_ACC=CAM_ASM_000384 /TAXON_ID=2969 /ORGANISM="Oxyrrhis marina" /LENGTH=57 /DNA_ID=CAMNT_0051330667 /DNA_START=1 /DNA_END=170 /DNA_ORIENTATION=-
MATPEAVKAAHAALCSALATDDGVTTEALGQILEMLACDPTQVALVQEYQKKQAAAA